MADILVKLSVYHPDCMTLQARGTSYRFKLDVITLLMAVIELGSCAYWICI